MWLNPPVGCKKMRDYCNLLWPMIYDQYNHGRHEHELAFYSQELKACNGPILEVACGTGMILLPLLDQGLNIYGFDLSEQMLDTLLTKAAKSGRTDVPRRVTRQNMIDFHYDMLFDAVFIPARSFLHLPTRDDQIACLRTIHRHLRDHGRLMINFFTPAEEALRSRLDPNPPFSDFETYTDAESGRTIKVMFRQVNDLVQQIQHITWRFQIAGEVQETPMFVRWIYTDEFESLVKTTGFRVAALYSGFDKTPYSGDGEMVWILEKESA